MFDKLKLDLIDDWKKAWKFASVQFQAAGVILMTASEFLGQTWTNLPRQMQEVMPHASTIALVLFGMGLAGRFLTTKKKDTSDGTEQHPANQ